jgi:hypothetical protein
MPFILTAQRFNLKEQGNRVKTSIDKGRTIVEKGKEIKDAIQSNEKSSESNDQGTTTSKHRRVAPPSSDNRTPSTRPVVSTPAQTSTCKGALVSSFHPKYKVILDSCVGSRSNQIVTIYFKVLHQDAHQLLKIGVEETRTQVFDSEGNSRQAIKASIAGSEARYTAAARVPTGISTPCTIQFSNIVDFKNEALQHVFIFCQSHDTNGQTNEVSGEIEIKNLPIIWH